MNKLIMERVIKFRDERDWEKFHTGENLTKSLCIEAAELLELFQWNHEVENIDRLKEELADVLIYALLLIDKYQLDLEKIILEKIEKNKEKYPIKKAFGSSKKYNEF